MFYTAHLHQEDENLIQVRKAGSNFHVEAELLLKVPIKIDPLDEVTDEVSGLPAMVLKTTQRIAEEVCMCNTFEPWNFYPVNPPRS